MKCVICGFKKGHFVCSRSPAATNYNQLLRAIAGVNDEMCELKCANEAFIEVLHMAHPQIGRRTQILKSEGGEEIDCLLIPKEEVESVLERYSKGKIK